MTYAKNICVDANVLLEVLLPGRENIQIASDVLASADNIAITPLTMHIYVYLGAKLGFDVQELISDLGSFEILSMNEDTVRWAMLNRKNNDFEDALQVASAFSGDCEFFYTFDKQLAKDYTDLAGLKVELLC